MSESKNTKRYLIFLNGEYGTDSAEFYRELCAGGVVIAADAAIEALRAFGITADILLGDFDSAPGAIEEFEGQAEIIVHDRDKDETDGELALELALERGAEELIFCGYRGGQTDHALGNLMLLAHAQQRYARLRPESVVAVSEMERIWYLRDVSFKLTGKSGETVSVFPLDSEIRLSLVGFRYDVENELAFRGSTRLLRNELAGSEAEVSIAGAAFLIHHRSA